MLDSPHFAETFQAQVDAYVASDVREFHRETLPPDDVLDPLLDEIVAPADRDDRRRRRRPGSPAWSPRTWTTRGACRAIPPPMVPWPVTCRAGAAPELVVVLGTNHYGMKPGPVATDKDFETPFGRVATDRQALQQLADLYEGDLLQGQYDHAREHSVELQVTVLARLLGPDASRSSA